MEINTRLPTGVAVDYEGGYMRLVCSHVRRELRSIKNRSGRMTYWMQCMTCGLKGEMIKHADAHRQSNGRPIKPIDDSILERYNQLRTSLTDEYKEKQQREWWDWYDQYLSSDEWKQRRSLVLSRSGGLCEGCRQQQATQVHHLSYNNVGNEMLWELVAVCSACHEKAHSES